MWASTQTPFALKQAAASLLGFPPQNVRVITPFVGGGFGGKSNIQQALEAVRLAKLAGKPVQVGWTRAEEFFYDTFRPAAVVKIKAGITESGLISFWDYGEYFAGERGAPQFYNIPHHRTMTYGSGWAAPHGAHPFGTGPWRAPGNNTNTFARESHIDMLACPGRHGPRRIPAEEFAGPEDAARLAGGGGEIRLVAGKSSQRAWISGWPAGWMRAHTWPTWQRWKWTRTPGTSGLSASSALKTWDCASIPRAPGCKWKAPSPWDLGYALSEEVRFTGGEIHDTNFDTYTIPHFSWVPEIETVVIDAEDSPAQGGGEPAIICMGAVIANAVFNATGARLRQLPMTPERIKAALPHG